MRTKLKLFFVGFVLSLCVAATQLGTLRNWFTTWSGPGALSTSAADNSVALSNYLASGGGLIPPGTYNLTKPVIANVPTKLRGFGPLTVFNYTGPSNVYALTFKGGNSQVSDFVLECNQWVGLGVYTGTVATAGGAINFNALGMANLSRVQINNSHGNALYVAGDGNFMMRSNAAHIAEVAVSNVYNGCWLAQSNLTEFVKVSDFIGRRVQNVGIFIGSANVLVSEPMLNGYVTVSGSEPATGVGIMVQPTPVLGRSHTRVIGGQVAHFNVGVLVTDAGGPVEFTGGISGGVGYNIFSNSTAVRLVGFTSEVWGQHVCHGSVGQMQAVGCTFINGTMSGWHAAYLLQGNTLQGLPLPTSTGTGDLFVWRNLTFQSSTLTGRPTDTNFANAFRPETNNGTLYYVPLYR